MQSASTSALAQPASAVARRASRRLTTVTRSQAAPEQQQKQELLLVGPDPQKFAVAEGQLQTIASAAFPAAFRLGSGALCSGYKVSFPKDDGKYAVATVLGRAVRETSAVGSFRRPQQPIVLYEFEGCPFCRKVREAVAILDLDVLFKPCPQGGPTYRPEANAAGGKKQFPYMVDPNTGTAMYESDAIISYLFEQYGDGKVPLGLRLGFLTVLSCGLAMLPRLGKGSKYKASKAAAQPLVLWGYEASPFVKVVREALCEREIAHVFRSCARGSPKRQELFEQRGHFQVPYLEDPNQGVCMWESAQIVRYIDDTYAA